MRRAGYVAAIEAALTDKQIRNIALSGNYGVGKSSILREVARRHRKKVVDLSLSTLAPIEASNLNDSVSDQAMTPTNRIQQEIVKQLLYLESPGKTPASRFQRIERFKEWPALGNAVLLGFFIALTFLLTGWTEQIISVLKPDSDIGIRAHLFTWVLATGVTFLMSGRFHGKLHLKQVSAGSATVTLNDSSVSYFDQYLDEIVYFFEVSGYETVIFEDIDRFNNSHIFETLRALNTLLNASPQITKNNKKTIRFIYAIKDSIFDHAGLEAEGRRPEHDTEDPAQTEVVRANRTKFFDLIIPVVPFITHRSARNLVAQLLGTIEHKVAPELLDLAAQYVPDMRLLKNIRNEFIVFRDRIFSGDGKQLKLTETELFAMMLYKSTHLTDFEKIRLGTSKLDTLYKTSRELVFTNIKRVESERRTLIQSLARLDGVAKRSEQLGAHLIAHVQRTAEAANYPWSNVTFEFDRKNWPMEKLSEVQFWTDFIAPNDNTVLQWRNSRGHTLSFNRHSLTAPLNDSLKRVNWDKTDHEALQEKINKKTADIKLLRSADLADLAVDSKFLVKSEGGTDESEQPFDVIATRLLKPGFAYQLIRAGYINRNFTLYTSTFHGDRLGPAGMNFIIHHFQQNLMDEYFELPSEDVDAIVRELGKNVLKEHVLYNISILDRLLAVNVEAADIMIQSLASLEEDQTRFLRAYFAAGDEQIKFIERFMAASSSALLFLITDTGLDDISVFRLVDAAVKHLSLLKQRTNTAVHAYLLANYAELTALTSNAITKSQADRIGLLFADADILVPRIELLSLPVRNSFISRNLYEVTPKNLTIAINNENVTLDVIREINQTVYEHVLRHLNKYLCGTDGISATINANENFRAVIEDILEQDADCLGSVIERATPECKVMDLSEVSEGAWPALAEHQRFPATFSNVNCYFVSLGSVDISLAKILASAGKITDSSSDEEESKEKLALAILAETELLPSAELRAELVDNLSLENYLGIHVIAAENGKLFSLLLKHNIIKDVITSYNYLATMDWPTRMAFIQESAQFINYMTPDLVRTDLAELFVSNEIDKKIKVEIIKHATEYIQEAEPDALNALAQFATLHSHDIPVDVIQKMAEANVVASKVILLLEPHLESISRNQLFTILAALKDSYSQLTKVGYDKPRVPNTVADRALLTRLKEDGIVSTYNEEESPIKVNKKHR